MYHFGHVNGILLLVGRHVALFSGVLLAPPTLSREDSNKIDPLEKQVEDLEASLRDKDGKIASLQE